MKNLPNIVIEFDKDLIIQRHNGVSKIQIIQGSKELIRAIILDLDEMKLNKESTDMDDIMNQRLKNIERDIDDCIKMIGTYIGE